MSDHEVNGLPLPPRLVFLIAVNRESGADVAIALDYRTSMTDPRVVASDWQGQEGTHI